MVTRKLTNWRFNHLGELVGDILLDDSNTYKVGSHITIFFPEAITDCGDYFKVTERVLYRTLSGGTYLITYILDKKDEITK